jgi:CubicO group peptidase (beta-lactamase class C family)
MRKTLLLFTLILTIAGSSVAQEKRVVRIGGGNSEEKTRDWPKLAAKSGATNEELNAAVDAYVAELTKRDLFSGTVLVARDGKPLYFKSFGLADKEKGTPNTNETKYNIGSINKIFTKLALLQLRAEGKIDFDQPLRRYLAEPQIDERITIRQLLEHSSGMGDFFGPKFEAASKEKLKSLRDYVPLFDGAALQFEPGTNRRYSNAGYIVLGLLIEKLSDMSYYDYVRTKIFAPAGMRDTDSFAKDEQVAKRAIGYTDRDGAKERHTNFDTLPGRGSSAGGGYSTASDLLRFIESLRSGKLASADIARAIGVGGGGWGGGAPGLNAAVESEDDWAIVVLSNYDPPAAEEVARNLRRFLGLAGE